MENTMWICLNYAFVSAVQDRNSPDWLCIRARKRAHLESLFPGQEIVSTPKGDYSFRVFVPKAAFAELMRREIEDLNYSNFKGSVRDPDLHDL
jgi:hypothetical protein